MPYRGCYRAVALTLAQCHRTVTKVKVGTICVDVLSNSRKFETLMKSVTNPMAHIIVSRMPIGSRASFLLHDCDPKAEHC